VHLFGFVIRNYHDAPSPELHIRITRLCEEEVEGGGALNSVTGVENTRPSTASHTPTLSFAK